MKKFLIASLVLAALAHQAHAQYRMAAEPSIFSPVTAAQIPAGTPPKVTQPPVESPDLFRGKTVAILASHGVEETEILFPYQYLIARGAQVDVLVPSWATDGIVTSRFMMPSLHVRASGSFRQGWTKRYDLLVLTGGAWNAQVVRTDDDALALIRNHYGAGRPVAAICAGTVVLVNAGLARGLTMTGSPPVKLDLQNAGARYQDAALVYDRGIFTSRTPDDVPAFVVGIRRALIGR